MRIAILGGSFDPIHNGHLQIAKHALKKMAIDEVWFMPTKDTPLKDHRITPFVMRSQMIRFAIRPYRHMQLCTLENRESEKSYTIDTVMLLKKIYPTYEFCWLIGSDQALLLDQWKDIQKLMELIPFYVFTRNGMQTPSPYPLHYVEMGMIDISSTDIRNGFKLHMVPKTVRSYIGEHGLYIDTMIKTAMSEHRYLHSKNVAMLCQELACAHHIDEKQAYLCGMFHDVCKQWTYEQAQVWMKYLEPSLIEEHHNIWHAYIASKYVKRYYHIEDQDVLFAIRNHVKGSSKKVLSMILYVADKLDPTRGYDTSQTLTLCKKDIHAGYEEVQQQQHAYLLKTLPKGVEHE